MPQVNNLFLLQRYARRTAAHPYLRNSHLLQRCHQMPCSTACTQPGCHLAWLAKRTASYTTASSKTLWLARCRAYCRSNTPESIGYLLDVSVCMILLSQTTSPNWQPASSFQSLTTDKVKVCASETAALHHWLVGLKDAPAIILVRAAKGNGHELNLQVQGQQDSADDVVARQMQWHIAACCERRAVESCHLCQQVTQRSSMSSTKTACPKCASQQQALATTDLSQGSAALW